MVNNFSQVIKEGVELIGFSENSFKQNEFILRGFWVILVTEKL